MVTLWAIEVVPTSMLAGMIAIPAVLFGRFISIALPFCIMKLKYTFPNRMIRIFTWGGLRGGLPLAMALALYSTKNKNMFCHILTMTLFVVAFSIIVQGLTIKGMIERSMKPEN
jgi:CPA1 family monovalent cation:H+ antiporter